MKVLSLFDGISCGRVALDRAGHSVDEYHAWEIEPSAIEISRNNHPNIVQHGDVTETDFRGYRGFDLLLGGSPCQGFSSSGKGLNFDDPRSRLFFEFVRAVKEAGPKYFLLENVKMKKEWQDVISQHLGVEPILINSALLSAQSRPRLYWTNIPGVTIPPDRGLTLDTILETGRDDFPAAIRGRRLDERGHRSDYNKDVPITQCLEVRKTNTDKSNCLTTVDKDNVLTPLPPGRYPDAFKNSLPFRYYTVTEYERLQTLPDGYTAGVSEGKAKKAIGNAWTVDVIAWILSHIPREDDAWLQ